jgi:hypothetical protein
MEYHAVQFDEQVLLKVVMYMTSGSRMSFSEKAYDRCGQGTYIIL